MDRKSLAARIKQTAYFEGEFTLRSGRKSSYYLDKYMFETQPDILRGLGEMMQVYVTSATTLIAGAELGGVALAAATALACDKPFIIIRNSKKDYGTSKMVEGAIQPSDRVLLVEDVVTSGGQIIEAAKVIQASGATVERIVAVIDRMEGARDAIEAAGFEFDSLITREDLGIGGAE